MRLGIHINTFRRSTVEASLDAVSEHGLGCVHFNFKATGLPSMPQQIDSGLCDRTRAQLAARRIDLATLSGTFNMIHPDPRVRREGLRRLEVLAAAARPLGTSVVTLCTGTRDPDDMWRRHPDNGTREAWQDLLTTMNAALQIAEKHDVTMAFEPEVGNVVDSAARGRRLLDEMRSPRLKVIMDAANLFAAGALSQMHEILERAFELLGADIVAAHAKDLDRDGAAGELPAGRGLLDYDHYLALFRRIHFNGPLIFHSLEETDVPACVAFLRGKLEQFSSEE